MAKKESHAKPRTEKGKPRIKMLRAAGSQGQMRHLQRNFDFLFAALLFLFAASRESFFDSRFGH
ncbi:MAG: hypothetical protein ABL996_15915 [Micropepsaceae bacterium]